MLLNRSWSVRLSPVRNEFFFIVLLLALFGLLSAARIGDLVRFKNLSGNPEFNGKFGLIQEFTKGRANVRTFLDHLLFDPTEKKLVKTISAYFRNLAVKVENLEVITKDHWKVDPCAMIKKPNISAEEEAHCDDIIKKILSSEDFYRIKLANTSLALINSGNVLNSCEEVEIIGTWMNLTFQTSFLPELPDFSAMNSFKEGKFVFIEGFDVNDYNYQHNGKVGIIIQTTWAF